MLHRAGVKRILLCPASGALFPSRPPPTCASLNRLLPAPGGDTCAGHNHCSMNTTRQMAASTSCSSFTSLVAPGTRLRTTVRAPAMQLRNGQRESGAAGTAASASSSSCWRLAATALGQAQLHSGARVSCMGGVIRSPAVLLRAGVPTRLPQSAHASPLAAVQPVTSTSGSVGELGAASRRTSSGAACSSSSSGSRSAVCTSGPVRGLGRPLPSAGLRRRRGASPIAAVGTPAVGSGSGVADSGANGSTGSGNGADAAAAATAAAAPSNHHPPGSSNGDNGSSAAASASTSSATAASASDPAPEPEPAAASTSLDGLPETQKYVYADEWGFSRVGADFPPGSHPSLFSQLLPQALFAFDARAAVAAVAVPLAAMAAGYGWLWYMHSIAPVWQQALCAALIGGLGGAVGLGWAGLVWAGLG